MKSRLLSLRKTIATILEGNKSRTIDGRKYATKPQHCDAHMNELPVPCGPWDIYYKDKQKYYNLTLVAGLTWFIISAWLLIYTDSMFFNWDPPCMPGPPSDMPDEEECEEP